VVRQALAQGIHGAFLLGLGFVAVGLAAVVLYMPSGSVGDHAPEMALAAAAGDADA